MCHTNTQPMRCINDVIPFVFILGEEKLHLPSLDANNNFCGSVISKVPECAPCIGYWFSVCVPTLLSYCSKCIVFIFVAIHVKKPY